MQLGRQPAWNFSQESKVTLPGAHGSEIVRSFCFLDEVRSIDFFAGTVILTLAKHKMVLTAGEDGKINAWRGD